MRARSHALPALLLLAGAACGKQTFLAAAFVQTPALPNPQNPATTVPQLQVMTAYFGTIDTRNPTHIDASAIAPIAAATPSVAFHHQGNGGSDPAVDRWLYAPGTPSRWTQSNGTYTLSSNAEPLLTFEIGVPYTLVLTTPGPDGDAYGARFVPAPPTDIREFQNTSCQTAATVVPRCLAARVATPLTLTRTDGPTDNGAFLPAFVLVGKIDPNNPSAQPQVTYETVPRDAAGLLRYVLSDAPYRLQSFVVPGSAFAQPGDYIVSLLAVRQGAVSGNLFPGSTALAASGAAGIVRAQ